MTVTRPATATGVPVSTNGHGASPPPGRNLNVGRLALGVLLVVGLSAGFALKYAEAGSRKSVLAVARAVPAGQAITAADLTEARVSADAAVHPVPVGEEKSVIGHAAAVALVPGTLLSRAQLATGPLVPAGRDVVGLSLKPGQVPIGLRVGDRVVVVRTPTNATTASAEAPTVLGRNASVLAVQAASANAGGTTVASVIVDAGDAPDVAAAGASGQASLVVEGGR